MSTTFFIFFVNYHKIILIVQIEMYILSFIPKSNSEFWKNKLERNVERNKKNHAQLKNMKIKVIVAWGCEIKNMIKD